MTSGMNARFYKRDGSLNVSEAMRQAFRELGTDATADDVREFADCNFGEKLERLPNIGSARYAVKRERMKLTVTDLPAVVANGQHNPNTATTPVQGVVDKQEKLLLESPTITEVVQRVKEVMRLFSSKEELKRLIDML